MEEGREYKERKKEYGRLCEEIERRGGEVGEGSGKCKNGGTSVEGGK